MSSQPLGICTIVLNEDKTKVLMGIRKGKYKASFYGLPGGMLELEETLENGARRELFEETSIVADKLSYIGTVRELQGDNNFIHFVFCCSTFQGVPTLVEPEKCEGWEWIDLENVPENIIPGHKAAIDMYINSNSFRIRDITKAV